MTIAAADLIERYHLRKDALRFSERERLIFEYRYGVRDGQTHTYTDIARRCNVSPVRIQQIVLRMVDKLVALVGKSWNRFCEEIAGFAALLREAEEVYGGSVEAVRKSS